jgi:putative ABC transport system permease protein
MKLRLALRSVFRAPGFASFSVLVMALGIGLTTVAFFVLNAVLLQPLDLPSPDRLVRIHPVFKKSGRLVPNVPGLDFRDLRDRAEAFSAMAAYWSGRTTILVGGRAEQVRYTVVSPGWHKTLGVQPLIGRGLFSNGTDEASVLISHAFWQSRMGADPNALKRSIQAEGRVYGICGVMPGAGVFPEKADVWAPMIPENDGADRSAFNYRVIGRLLPGISAEQGKASLAVVAAALELARLRARGYREAAPGRRCESAAAPFGRVGPLLRRSARGGGGGCIEGPDEARGRSDTDCV